MISRDICHNWYEIPKYDTETHSSQRSLSWCFTTGWYYSAHAARHAFLNCCLFSSLCVCLYICVSMCVSHMCVCMYMSVCMYLYECICVCVSHMCVGPVRSLWSKDIGGCGCWLSVLRESNKFSKPRSHLSSPSHGFSLATYFKNKAYKSIFHSVEVSSRQIPKNTWIKRSVPADRVSSTDSLVPWAQEYTFPESQLCRPSGSPGSEEHLPRTQQ